MPKVFKPKGSKKYVVYYYDENGKRRKKTFVTDKTVSERICRDFLNKVVLRREGVIDPRADAYLAHEARPLGEHLDDWHKDMVAKGKTLEHADQYQERAGKLAAVSRGIDLATIEPGRKAEALRRAAEALAEALRAIRLRDLDSEPIQAALAELRLRGKSPQTANHYRAALRAFCRWAKAKKRLRDNPMDGVDGFNVDEDIRHVRRSLTDDEMERLIRATAAGPVRFGMPGALRAIAYRAAGATGFRVQELRSLVPENFRLDDAAPVLVLKASSTKNRRPADQPVPLALAADLREWLRDIPAGATVFPLHHETAKAIRADLEAAGIAYETEEGVADFHSLRAYYITGLVRAGASVKALQTLARHAKPETTLKHYAKVSGVELRQAIESLPASRRQGLPAPDRSPAGSATPGATGTPDGETEPEPNVDVTPDSRRFAKPLTCESAFGGSNPPLSVFPSSRCLRTPQPTSNAGFRANQGPPGGSYDRWEARSVSSCGPPFPPQTTSGSTGEPRKRARRL